MVKSTAIVVGAVALALVVDSLFGYSKWLRNAGFGA